VFLSLADSVTHAHTHAHAHSAQAAEEAAREGEDEDDEDENEEHETSTVAPASGRPLVGSLIDAGVTDPAAEGGEGGAAGAEGGGGGVTSTGTFRKRPYELPKRSKLVPALKKRLYSSLVHKLTQALTEGVVEHATLQTTPLVFDKVADVAKRYVPAAAAHGVTAILSAVVPMTVGTGAAEAMNRALPPYLLKTVTSGTIDTVTRATTHILSSTLSQTLSQSPVVHYYCYYCKYWGHYCDECHRNVATSTGPQMSEYAHQYRCLYSDHYATMYRDATLWEELGADGPKTG
jgi:hypothetical protein